MTRLSKSRPLPKERNPNMDIEGDDVASSLSSRCKAQEVPFDNGDVETFVRIKTHIPGNATPHFIMRKADDDFVSATSMFRAVFPDADNHEEKIEMAYIKSQVDKKTHTNAAGLWIPAAPEALDLAAFYGIQPWIQALLDAPTVKSAYPEDSASPAPSVRIGRSMTPIGATPSATRKSLRQRSASPKKRPIVKARKAVKDATASDIEAIKEELAKEAEYAGLAPPLVSNDLVNPADAVTTRGDIYISHEEPDIVVTKKQEEVDGEPLITYHSEVVSDGKKTIEELIAEATAQVEAAQAADAAALAKTGLSPRITIKREFVPDEDDEVAMEKRANQLVSVKRGKVEGLEIEVVKERRKVRALFGLVIGLGASAILPYVL